MISSRHVFIFLLLRFLHATQCCLSFRDSTFHFIIPLFIALFLSLSHHGARQPQIIVSHHTTRDTNEPRARSLNSQSLILDYMFLSLLYPPLHPRLLSALVPNAIRSVFCMSHSNWLHSDNPIKSTSRGS